MSSAEGQQAITGLNGTSLKEKRFARWSNQVVQIIWTVGQSVQCLAVNETSTFIYIAFS